MRAGIDSKTKPDTQVTAGIHYSTWRERVKVVRQASLARIGDMLTDAATLKEKI
jgi:hypothetical protein